MTRYGARNFSSLVFACAALLAAAQALAGDLFVSSVGTDSVLRYNGATGASLGTFAGPPTGFPEGVIFGPDGNLYVSGGASNGVGRYNGTTGAFIDAFVPAKSGGLSGADGLTFGPDGNLYVVSFRTNSVMRYNGTTGAFMGVFATAPGLVRPEGLVFGPDGNLYVGSSVNDSVLRFNGSTGALIGTFVPSGSGGLDFPVGLLFDRDGNLMVASENTSSVLRYSGTTGAFLDAFVTSGSGGLTSPRGIVYGDDGNLYVADVCYVVASSCSGGAVLRYNGTTGAFIGLFVPPASGGLNLPTFLTFNDQISGETPGQFWIGLKNGDDVGTQFDLKTDVYVDSTLVGSQITRCIVGLARNPDTARAVSPPAAFAPFEVDDGSTVHVKLSARIGTNADDTKCSGPGGSHNSASGLRLYYDSIARASRVNLDFAGDSTLYLHSNGGICTSAPSFAVTDRFLDPNPPDGTLVKCNDSGALSFAGGNPWKEIGTWSVTP